MWLGFSFKAANALTRAAVIVSTYSRGTIGELTTDNRLRSLKGARSRLLLSQVLAHDGLCGLCVASVHFRSTQDRR